jgi:DNA polymerase III delta prime subunit
MHAFLLVGSNREELKTKSEEMAKKLHAKVMEFPLAKIEDVRGLNNLLRLSFSEPTLIVSENIEDATEEALNAFLKNLEEPQENVFFALTAPSVRKVLPTIVSRCQIIKTENRTANIENGEEIKRFLEMSPSQKLAFFDKIGGREKAIDFIESLIFFLHDKGNLTNMELMIKTLTRLKANGNVNLHLLNLVTQYDEKSR